MKRILAALFAASLFATSAIAQTPPVPLGPSGASAVPLGPSSGLLVAVPLGPGLQSSGSGPPPTCSNALDFSQACNSQYIFMIAEPFQ